MATVEEVKEITNDAKEVATASGDVVDKVFSHLDTYFKAVADALTSEQAKEFGKSVIDTGLTVVQVDAIIYVGSWLFSLFLLSGLVYLFYRTLFEKVVPLVGSEREAAMARATELEIEGPYNRTATEDRELVVLQRKLGKIVMAAEDWRQFVGGLGLAVSSVLLALVALLGFNAWKFVAIFEPKLYVVKMAIDKIL